MAYFHKNLTQEKWNNLDKSQQILNIGSELNRAKHWLEKEDREYMRNSLERVLELIDLTSQDKKWCAGSLRELRRLRELLGEYYLVEKTGEDLGDLLKILFIFSPNTSQVKL